MTFCETPKKIGILITNTGTPDESSVQATRRYLREFLSDQRIVQLPRFIWLPILYGLILPFRAKKSAKLYQLIAQKSGLPLRTNMLKIAEKVEQQLNQQGQYRYTVKVGMNYGNPSIQSALKELEQSDIDTLITLPLFPQYSNTTTAATHDRVVNSLQKWQHLPHHHFIRDYADHPHYIAALCNRLKQFWQTHGKGQHLLISFHGIPKRYIDKGDPYATHCQKTAKALANTLSLQSDEWTLCYQSQFGYDKWLQPATQTVIQSLAQTGLKTIDVICPGFSVDCLETLEEIAIRYEKEFVGRGGEQLRYCAALNDQIDYITAILNVFASGNGLKC